MTEEQEVPWPKRSHRSLHEPTPLGTFGHKAFRSAFAKLHRVEEVYQALRLEAEGLRLDFLDVLRIELTPDRSTYRFIVDNPPTIPSHWAVTTGEALYNLRSALDHAAFELSVRGLGRDLDPDEAFWSQFTLTDSEKKFRERAKKELPGLSVEQLDLIERVQPYLKRGREHEPTLFDQAAYSMGLLNRLGNVEKHRHPHLVVGSVDGPSWRTGQPEPRLIRGPVEQGRVIMEMDYFPEFRPYESTQPRVTFAPVLLDDDGPVAFPGVLGTLRFMAKRVLDVLNPTGRCDPSLLDPIPPRRH
ncbi:hypothetical protein SAMN04489867_0423 [Pedococcus dokdonensis]|uniref:Uncharacterized protein n=1 Tax=Pedococcus dokdonensis TaxID=443156 RepID=A0A1H0LX37_9MICO|nr:hypothetical protein [Pedococcus dokdonensis]SDO72653.1 hypothetical protein SAMN04489867_0423 [Pedococcus dokdonensis]